MRRVPPWLREVLPLAAVIIPPAIVIATNDSVVLRHLALLAFLSLVLLLRRRHALAVFALIAVATLADPYGPSVTLPLLLALFNVARRCDRRAVAVCATAAASALILGPLLHGRSVVPPGEVLSRLVAIGLAVAAGLYFAARGAYVEGLQDRATRLERERELLAEQAVAEERVRIARELHDVVAHGVSLMVVQAQAIEAQAGPGPHSSALRQIANTGREALSEMNRMLGVLRTDVAGTPELLPAPGVRDVPALLEGARTAGLDVALEIDGEERPLPAGVDLSAYRIVQEALTNVIKHAHARRTRITLRYASGALELSVIDDGRGPSSPKENGHGLLGMRERVALFGGSLQTGTDPQGRGFVVRATLPTAP